MRTRKNGSGRGKNRRGRGKTEAYAEETDADAERKEPQPAPCFSCGPDTYQVICNALSADAPFSDTTPHLLQNSHADANRTQRTQSVACFYLLPTPKEKSQLPAAGQTLSSSCYLQPKANRTAATTKVFTSGFHHVLKGAHNVSRAYKQKERGTDF